MKTFTVTIHRTTNYGAVLQAYALQQAIIGMGADNEIFDYIEGTDTRMSLKKAVKNPSAAVKMTVIKLLRLIHKKEISRKKRAVDEFHNRHMKLSRKYNSMDELKNDPPDVVALFTGSDQVWRFPEGEEFIEARFLNFGKDNVKKFSYAASIEKMNYTEEQVSWVKNWLGSFNKIALREQSAADYINSITGYPTRRVLDPVFLLEKDQWLKLVEVREIKEPFILCYQVQSAPRMQAIVDHLKKVTGYRTVAVLPYATKWLKTDEALYDASPEEFLYLLSKAEIVVAASFHGAALGIEFGKVVYATSRDGHSERIKGIMDLLGAGDFYVSETSAIPDHSTYPLDRVNERLCDERSASKDYLLECLKSE